MKSRILTVLLALLLLAACTFLLVACGGGGDTPSALSSPSGFSYNGSILSWSEVVGAEKYSVQIGTGEPFSTGSTGYPFINTSGEAFTVSVTAICEGMENSPTATHTFIPLASVSSFTVTENGALSWDAVEGATEYQIEVDGKTVTVTEPLYTGLSGGTHTVRVKPAGTPEAANTSYYAVWSAPKTITRLSAVAGEGISFTTESGVLSWGKVEGAVKYHLVITGDLTVDTMVTLPRYELSPTDDFTVSITAIGDNNQLYNSPATEKTFLCLDTVTSLRVEDGMLKWNAVEKALGYRLRVNGTVQGGVITDCYYRGFPAEEQFTVSVLPIAANNASFATWSAPLVFTFLQTPVLKWNDYTLDGTANNNLYWNPVTGASGYEVRLAHNGTVIATEQLGAGTVAFAHAYDLVGEYTVSVRALAPANGNNRYASSFSTPITVKRLAAPKGSGTDYITSNPTDLSAGFTASFVPVAGATSYRVWRNGGIYQEGISGNFYRDQRVTDGTTVQQTTHTYSIQSVGSLYNAATKTVVLDSLTREALSFTITVLATPTAPTMSGFTYSYSAVSGAQGYGVRYANTVINAQTTTCDLSDIRSGRYELQVCARGDGGQILPSPYSVAITVIRLSAPGNIQIRTDESDGVLQFSGIEHAQSYEAMIDGSSSMMVVNGQTNVKDRISLEGTSLYITAVANYYSNDRTEYYMTSPPSAAVTFIKLASPTELRFEGGTLLWNAPANVKDTFRPTYTIADGAGSLYPGAQMLQSPQYDASALAGGQTHIFRIKAIGDGSKYVNSDSSFSWSAERLEAPTVTRTEGAYLISSVENAGSYAVFVDNVLVQTIPETGEEAYTFTPNFDRAGTYTLRVIAVAAGGRYFDSPATNVEQEVKMLTTPTFEATLSSGVLTVNITDPEFADLRYSYTVAGKNEISGQSYTAAVTGGSVTVRVYAVGGIFVGNIYYLDSQSAPKTVSAT